MNKLIKKLAPLLVLALMLTTLAPAAEASAASSPKLNASSATALQLVKHL